MKRKFVVGTPPPANQPQRQPTPQQVDAAQRILSHDHQRTYGEGAKGATIRALQIYLASKGYEPGRFDGDWGAKTEAAFKAYNADRGQSFARATPEALAGMSKEAGQPLPRQRPAQAGDITAEATAEGGLSPVHSVAAKADIPPPAPAAPLRAASAPDPDALDRGYGQMAGMNVGEGYGSEQHGTLYPPGAAPVQRDYGALTDAGAGQMAGMNFGTGYGLQETPDGPAAPPGAAPIQPQAAATAPPANPLRDALINGPGQQYAMLASANPTGLDALRQALIARGAGR